MCCMKFLKIICPRNCIKLWPIYKNILYIERARLKNYEDICIMVSALDSGSSGPGSDPRWGHRVVFLSKTLYSHGASLHPGV